MVTPDGMASMAQERQHMREMRQLDRQPSPPWELAAMDFEGEEMYRTEYADTKEEAVQMAAELNSSDPDTPELPEGVARFKPVETEE